MLNGVDPEGLRIEVPQLRQFALGPDDVRAAEQVPWSRSNLAVHHVVVGLAVALNLDAADAELLAFHHPNLDVNGVPHHPLLEGARIEREVTVVLVE